MRGPKKTLDTLQVVALPPRFPKCILDKVKSSLLHRHMNKIRMKKLANLSKLEKQ